MLRAYEVVKAGKPVGSFISAKSPEEALLQAWAKFGHGATIAPDSTKAGNTDANSDAS